ncbi:hemolysin III family protein [Massilibacteroides sp.]|uniref:PAQR family membrane homeostasis protein TrhA n=1 Tax=Massilibacteroides sp. TaxID=2034766 RepID=UPI0026297D47|nr:hemolysin III family protein [Massilibacteroides sp.]MDD4515007.1 hemolysin III family protein [Massilibacteroides sp.]
MARERKYTKNEELWNASSHAFGILLGVVAGYYLLKAASGNSWAVGSVLVYLFGMLTCYVLSTSYHATVNEKRKQLLQKFDHASIYLHIAASYTPFTLVTLRNEGYWGWGIFAFVWLAAIIGVVLSFRKYEKHNYFETICYIVMGCSILVALNPLLAAFTATGKIEAFYWLIAGGVSYIVGALFYSFAKLRYMHTVFHFFVLGGSVCHILAIYLVVA